MKGTTGPRNVIRALGAWMACGLLGATVLMAGDFGGHHAGPRGEKPILGAWLSERIAEALELTPEQRQAARAVRDEALQVARPKLEAVKGLHQELKALLEQSNPDPRAVGDKMISLHRVRQELKALREQSRERFVALLDANQKEKLEALEAMRPRPGRRGGPGRN